MANRVRTTTTVDEKKEQIRDEIILNRELLYTKDKEAMYIKYNNELVPVGGSLKQNYLEAGDNIEIHRRDENDEVIYPEIVRLADDIDINTCTLGKFSDTHRWKGTYKLGELNDNQKLFILTKRTDINEEIKGFIGGEILIKMITDKDEELYGHFAMTCASTGSWSLKGASGTANNVRMCRCKRLSDEEMFYGLKIPVGPFENYGTVDHPTHEITDLFSYVGLRSAEDSSHLWIYTSDTKYMALEKEDHIDDVVWKAAAGDADGLHMSRDLWTAGFDNYDWMVGFSENHPDMFGEETESEWANLIGKGYKIGLVMDTAEGMSSAYKVHATTSSIYLRRTGNHAFRLQRGTGDNWWTPRYDFTDRGYESQIYPDNPKPASNYNHWYTMPMPNFFNVLGITPEGDWTQYNNNNYLFGMRIYTNGDSTRITVVAIMRNTNALPQVKAINAEDTDIEFNWDSSLVNLKNGNTDGWDVAYPAMPQNTDVDIFKFIDRTAVPQKLGLQLRVVSIGVYDEDNNPVETDLDFTKFDNSYLTNNYNFIMSLGNNRVPVFGNNVGHPYGIPILLYEGQEDVTQDDRTTLLGEQRAAYDQTVHHYSVEAYMDELNIKHAEFWFNGWKDIPESLQLESYADEDFDYVVLSDSSTDNDYYAETRYFGTVNEYLNAQTGLASMQDTGEDNAPYKIIITQEYLSMQDLRNIASMVQHLERQVSLDLSRCTVRNDARVWNSAIFEGCVSLRELAIPKGVVEFGQGIFKWCTYMRKLDLTPSANTLTTIGGTAWEQNAGFLVSTRVTQLIIPPNVNFLRNYLVYASNLKSLIFLHDKNTSFIEDQSNATAAARVGKLSIAEWAWIGQTNSSGALTYELPEGFHLFFSSSFWNEGRSAGNNNGQPNRNGSGWDWYPNDANRTRWNKRVIDSIAIYPQDGTQEEWQAFDDQYHWGEDLINQVRAYFGHLDPIEIKQKLAY